MTSSNLYRVGVGSCLLFQYHSELRDLDSIPSRSICTHLRMSAREEEVLDRYLMVPGSGFPFFSTVSPLFMRPFDQSRFHVRDRLRHTGILRSLPRRQGQHATNDLLVVNCWRLMLLSAACSCTQTFQISAELVRIGTLHSRIGISPRSGPALLRSFVGSV